MGGSGGGGSGARLCSRLLPAFGYPHGHNEHGGHKGGYWGHRGGYWESRGSYWGHRRCGRGTAPSGAQDQQGRLCSPLLPARVCAQGRRRSGPAATGRLSRVPRQGAGAERREALQQEGTSSARVRTGPEPVPTCRARGRLHLAGTRSVTGTVTGPVTGSVTGNARFAARLDPRVAARPGNEKTE